MINVVPDSDFSRVPIEKSIDQTLILFYWFDDCYLKISYNVKLFASKFTAKKLGGAVGS